MKTIIAGASGFIGQHLCSMLKSIGDEIITLSREDFITGKFDLLVHKLNGADRIFNLAGAPLNRRWTREYKKEIFNSRIQTTAKLVAAINEQPTPPSLFVSTSAIGYYPSDGAYIENAEVYTPTFLAYICRKWEKEAEQVTPQTRLVITRLAPVLSTDGGIFPPLASLFRYGLGGKIGSGKQAFPLIMLTDLLRIYRFIIEHTELKGVLNCSAPDITDNALWAKSLGQELRRPVLWTIPPYLLRAILGERSVLLTEGQHAIPYKLEKNGFTFEYTNICDALDRLCEKKSDITSHVLEY